LLIYTAVITGTTLTCATPSTLILSARRCAVVHKSAAKCKNRFIYRLPSAVMGRLMGDCLNSKLLFIQR